MKTLIFIFAVIIFIDTHSNEWVSTKNQETKDAIPTKFSCVDSNLCFLYLYFNSQSMHDYIIKTTNQGISWDIFYQQDLFESIKNKIPIGFENFIALNKNELFLHHFSDKIIYYTIDGANTFSKIDNINLPLSSHFTMATKNVGVYGSKMLITHDGWNTYNLLPLVDSINSALFGNFTFINDSILYCTMLLDVNQCICNKRYFVKINVNSFEIIEVYELDNIDAHTYLNMFVLDETTIFLCGKSNRITGGSGYDVIYKSSDGGKTWECKLDIYMKENKLSDDFSRIGSPFGLQQIAFKDSLIGIAVGQSGKILYTYDGGDTWRYEDKVDEILEGVRPNVMHVFYAGSYPTISNDTKNLYRLTKDIYRPKPEHTCSIKGRVVFPDGTGHPNTPVASGYWITMTDDEGYFTFKNLKPDSTYSIRAINKYLYSLTVNSWYRYKPYEFSPETMEIALNCDTSGIIIQSIPTARYKVQGRVIDEDGFGVGEISLRLRDSIRTTNSLGEFELVMPEGAQKIGPITSLEPGYRYEPEYVHFFVENDTSGITFTIVKDGNSVAEHNANFTLSPNPAGEYIEVIQPSEGFKPSEGSEITITNMLGIVVSTSVNFVDTSASGGQVRIDVSHLPRGVYFLRIGTQVEKFVKW